MSWTYMQTPQDGTIWLEWLPTNRADNSFPSDGYVWGDGEATYRQEFRGYTIELMKHTIGYRMQYDQVASHARTRYHIIAKNPSVNAPPPDPALWIVHYHQADQNRMLPSSQVPFGPHMQQIMQERRWLESQGKIERREFMLHDRQSWPMVKIPNGASMPHPGMQQQGFYGNQMQQNRFPAFYDQQAGQQPPAKRQRTSTVGAEGDIGHELTIEDEENTTLGDFFDHLTPRDISVARYMQHQRWMEEVFSSPYASNQIVPPDLGLGLMGELKGLTDGILEPPSVNVMVEKPGKAKEAEPFTNLSKDQVDEFSKRLDKFMEEGQAEIERMRAEHEAKMREWRKGSKLMSLTKRLGAATWEGHENATPSAFRLEDPITKAAAQNDGKSDTVEQVVREAEELFGMKINARKELSMVEKGGLEREEEQPKQQPTLNAGLEQQQNAFMGQQQRQQQPTTTNVGGSEIYHGDPASAAMHAPAQTQPMQPPNLPQQQQAQSQQLLAQSPAVAPNQQITQGTAGQAEADISRLDDTAMEGIDLDENPIDFGDNELDLTPAHNTPGARQSMNEQTSISDAQQPPTTTSGPTATPSATSLPGGQQQHMQQSNTPATSTLLGDAGLDASGMADSADLAGDSADNSMFADNTFDDLVGNDEGVDADFDFSGGDMPCLDDSAFGDATFGMDTATPSGPATGEADNQPQGDGN